jgi:hypothetical protein
VKRPGKDDVRVWQIKKMTRMRMKTRMKMNQSDEKLLLKTRTMNVMMH